MKSDGSGSKLTGLMDHISALIFPGDCIPNGNPNTDVVIFPKSLNSAISPNRIMAGLIIEHV